ncbi:MAG: hypothetical protein OXC02_10470 [Rhodobacteraceae bacterium]|nr:hypothetical protein [Paracoccaceae bacterium]
MSIWEGSSDIDSGVERWERDPSCEAEANGVNEEGWHLGEISDGSSADPFTIAPSFAEEDCGRRGSVWDDINAERHKLVPCKAPLVRYY